MKKTILSITLMLASLATLNAQYQFAIGVRSGGTSGLTLKIINTSNTASELMVGFWNDGLSFTGLYERTPQVGTIEGLHWLLGMGAHVALYNDNFRNSGSPSWYSDKSVDIEDGDLGLGLDVMAGLEYKFPLVPLAISLELKPFVEFTTNGAIWLSLDPGLGIKLAF
jgi:hypothetical protein